ncbi:phage protease [Pseudogulbenkiania sp. NH8B]|uniref:phage protease n=1 Tax=Pseudogulbenkiania sp. (strain NH8B) TaxID=748280 RepID=UPI00130EBFA8|nr:phage protease [Pseudogulbenkiania sp. NH8B]
MNTTPLHRAINALFSSGRAINALTIDLPAEVPEWVELIPAGRFTGRDGRGPWFSDIPLILQAFISDQATGIEPVVDYDHQSCVVLQTGQKAEAAGWIKQLEERSGAIWGRVEWLAEAAQDIAGRRYRYLSPVFDYDATGRIVKLVSVGLTNVPNLFLRALNSMEEPGVELLKQLNELLGLEAGADAAAALAATKELQGKATATQTALNSLRKATGAAESADLQTVANSVLTQFVPRSEYERVANALSTQQQQSKEAEIDQVVDQAIADGKVAPANRGYFRAQASADLAAFKQFVAGAPVIAAPANTQRAANTLQERQDTNPLIANAKARAAAK